MRLLELNGDIGEIEPDADGVGDSALVPLLSAANIACGFHAGSEALMARSVALCLRHGVRVGAHPSFPDRAGFGRREMRLSATEIRDAMRHQLGALAAVATAQGARLAHVKPHGALYNMAATDRGIADAICAAVRECDATLAIVGLARSQLLHAAQAYGLLAIAEGFADRRYAADGTLLPRAHPRALIDDLGEMERQVESMVVERAVMTVDGARVAIDVDTVCVHGDGAHAVAFATRITQRLAELGIATRHHRSP